MEDHNKPVIDVIIPAYRPDDSFQTLIGLLQEQTVKPHHIYVLQTMGEGDELMQPMNSDMTVHSVAKKDFDHGATRDYGARLAAEGNQAASDRHYILFMTQDAVPANTHLIETLAKAFEDERTAIAYARQLAREGADVEEELTRVNNYPPQDQIKRKEDLERLGIKTYFCSDVCAMYDRIAYEEVGGFPGKVIFNEDEIFAAKSLKAGYDIRYEAQAVVIHSHNYSGVQYFKRYFDLGVSQADFSYIFNEYHAEDEGIRLVKQTFRYLMKRKSYFDIPVLFYHSGMKLIGMKLGKMYRKLPDKIIMKCTSNKAYWKR